MKKLLCGLLTCAVLIIAIVILQINSNSTTQTTEQGGDLDRHLPPDCSSNISSLPQNQRQPVVKRPELPPIKQQKILPLQFFAKPAIPISLVGQGGFPPPGKGELGISSVTPRGRVLENLDKISIYFNHPLRKPLLGYQGAPAVAKNELGISHFRPTGQIGLNLNDITVHFTHAMIPLGEIKKVEATDLGIRITPQLLGKFRWYGTKTWTFTATEPLKLSTRYRVTIPQGIRSVDGKQLRESFAFEFETNPVLAPDLGITINPPCKCLLLWQGERGITLQLLEKLQLATRYRVTLPAGLRSFDQRVLSQRFDFDLITSPPYVSGCTPGNDQSDVLLHPDIFLEFTQPVDASKMGKYIGVFCGTTAGNGALRPVKYACSQQKNTRRIYLKTVAPLPKESQVWVKVRSGWTGLQGGLACDRHFASRFLTYCPLRHQTFNCQYKRERSSVPGDTVSLHFNNPIVATNLHRHLTISPAPAKLAAAYVQDRKIFLPSSLFHLGRHHTITVGPGLTDIFGQQLRHSAREKIYMFNYNPSLGVNPGAGRVVPGSSRLLGFSTLNVPKLYMECYRADQQRIFSSQVSIRDFRANNLYHFAHKQYQKVINPDSAQNKTYRHLWSLDELANGKPGMYYLKLHTDTLRFHYEKYKSLQWEGNYIISDLGITARYGADNIVIFVSSLRQGVTLADVRLVIRNRSGKIVWQGATDAYGVAIVPGKSKLWQLGTEPRIFAARGDDLNYLELTGGSRDGWISGYSHRHSQPPRYKPFVAYLYTERGLYRPGHTVHLTGIFRKQDELSVRKLGAAGQQVQVIARDSRGKQFFSQATTISTFDTLSIDIPVPKDGPLGIYCAEVQVPGFGNASKDFDIQEYRVSDFEASVKADNDYFVREQVVSVTIAGKYLAGGPLADAEVKWKLQVVSSQLPAPSKVGYQIGNPVSDTGAYAYGKSIARLNGKGKFTIKLYPPISSKLLTTSNERVFAQMRLPRQRHQLLVEKRSQPVQVRKAPGLLLPKKAQIPNPPGIFFNGGVGVYRIIAEVIGANRQAVTVSGDFTIYPGKAYIGLRLGQKVMKEGGCLPATAVALAPDGKLISGLPITIKATHIFKQEGEYRLWAEKLLPLTSASDPVTYEIPLPACGDYEIAATVVADNQHVRVTDTAKAVEKTALVASGQPLELVPDKERYLPGETAGLLIRSPYQRAQGIICFERNDLVTYLPLRDIGQAHTLRFEVLEKMAPNIVAYVFLVSAMTEADDAVPQFRSGRCELKVTPANKRLQITLRPDSHYYAPEKEVSLGVSVRDWQGKNVTSHLALMVVDEGVLTLTSFQTPAPLAYFICPRPSWMATQEYSGNHIQLLSRAAAKKIDPENLQKASCGPPLRKFHSNGWEIKEHKPEPKPIFLPSIKSRHYEEECKVPCISGRDAGITMKKSRPAKAVEGIAQDSKLARQIAQRMSTIRIRKVFATTTYFNPALLTDKDGKATVRFRLPQNLTSFRIMAVGVDSDDRFGSTETRIVVRKPLTLKVSLPRFANVGDTFCAGVVVSNQSGQDGEVICNLEAKGIVIRDEKLKKVTLANGASLEIPYLLKAVRPGDIKFTFAAFMGKHQDGVVETIPVKYPATTETFATYGVVRNQPAQEAVLPPAKVWPGIGGLKVSFSCTAMTNLEDGITFLLTYPYGCLEQTSSRLFPLVGLHDLIREFQIGGLNDSEIRSHIAAGVARICSMQKSDGGFSYWPGSHYHAHPWATAYALFVLLHVRDAGHAVPKPIIDKAASYLYRYTLVNANAGDYHRLCTDTLALVTLAMSGKVNVKAMEHLYEQPDRLPIFAKAFLAYAYTLAPQNLRWKARALLQKILNQAVEEADDVHFKEEHANRLGALMHTNIRTDAIVMWLICHLDREHMLLPKLTRGIMKARIKGHWSNTQENAWALLALSKYLQAVEHERPDFAAVMKIGNHELLRKKFRGRTTRQVEAQMGIDELLSAAASKRQMLTIDKQGPGILYYRLGITYAPARLDISAFDRGISVTRQYQVLRGQQIADEEVLKYKLGTYIKVTVTVNLPKTRYYLAIDDPLPAGCEHVLQNFAHTAKFNVKGHNFDHTEKRKDRALAFSDKRDPGAYRYVYVIRATTPGTYILPPARAEEMYHPEVFGRSASRTSDDCPLNSHHFVRSLIRLRTKNQCQSPDEALITRFTHSFASASEEIDPKFAAPYRTYTTALEHYACELCRISTIKGVSRICGLSWDTVKRIDKRYLGKKILQNFS